MCTGVKELRREAEHSPIYSVEVKIDAAIHPLLHISSWHGA
jgi:hypothetical protein